MKNNWLRGDNSVDSAVYL